MQNPLESYRRTQRELRRQFEPFTRANCPTCLTPCCKRPARIVPADILLAESTGWRAEVAIMRTTLSSPPPLVALPLRDPDADLVSELAGRSIDALSNPPKSGEAQPDAIDCEFLGETGCGFPSDLRPLGCTTFICRYMYAQMERSTLSRIKRLVRELEEKHRILLRALRLAPNNRTGA